MRTVGRGHGRRTDPIERSGDGAVALVGKRVEEVSNFLATGREFREAVQWQEKALRLAAKEGLASDG